MTRRVLALLSLLAVGCAGPRAPTSAPHDLLGHSVSLSLPTDQGQLGAVPAGGAAVTVADFFSPTCVPCREKVPALFARRSDIEGLGGALVLVAVLGDGESTDDARAALTRWGVLNATFLVDSGDASKREAGVRALPTTLVLDKQGTLRWVASEDASVDQVVDAARDVAR
jgi:hypothetical protein